MNPGRPSGFPPVDNKSLVWILPEALDECSYFVVDAVWKGRLFTSEAITDTSSTGSIGLAICS